MSLTYKKDSRPKRGAWAPGEYLCKCGKCGEQFQGDKRAVRCADCAYSENLLAQAPIWNATVFIFRDGKPIPKDRSVVLIFDTANEATQAFNTLVAMTWEQTPTNS